MEASIFIEPASGPWTSPVVLMGEKDNSWRFCVDYWRLNEVTCKDYYPLLVSMTCSQISSLYLQSEYWQVELTLEARPKTAFSISKGLWHFLRMPFGSSYIQVADGKSARRFST